MSRRLGIVALMLAALLMFGCKHYPRRHHGPGPRPGFRYYWGESRRDDDHDRDRDRDRARDRDRERDERRRADEREQRERRDRHRD